MTFLFSSTYADTLWSAVYGGADDDGASSVVVDLNGNYVVAGYTYSYGSGYSDVWILKLDAETGDTLWSAVYGGTYSEGAEGVVVAPDGNYIVAGYTYSYGAGGSDLWLLKVDSSDGSLLWSRTFGSTDDDGAYSLAIDDSGYVIIAGYTTSAPYRDGYLLKVDADTGGLIWSRVYGGTSTDEFYAVSVDGNGDYILAGRTNSPSGGYFDVWMVKVNSSGDLLWERTYGGSLDDGAADVVVDNGGNYVVAGRTILDINDYNDIWILKLEPDNGDTLWTRVFSTSEPEGATAVSLLEDGNYVVAGLTSIGGTWDAWVMGLTQQGDSLWGEIYGGSDSDGATSLAVDGSGNIVVAGYTGSFGSGFSDVWVLKLTQVVSASERIGNAFHTDIVPGGLVLWNPSYTYGMEIAIYSKDGRLVKRGTVAPASQVRYHLPPGIYILHVSCCGGVYRSTVPILP